ncbi:uncharacterized protein LOC114241834 [Bombyx mandarina]|uniref:Uncharacterized protein LOC114241834 n=1 Tax=Bombyx mandarina TaxID=7092 RepID=A0A6J2JGB8_BOMMA|nr:uncharacterized protein LOC114241834 [Bombyx mandarina]
MKGICLIFTLILIHVASTWASLDAVDEVRVMNVESQRIFRSRRALPCAKKSCDSWCRRLDHPGGECVTKWKCSCNWMQIDK